MMKKYGLLAICFAVVAYYEAYMFAMIGIAVCMTVITVVSLNRSTTILRKCLSESAIVNIILVNFFALLLSGLILILSSYVGRYTNTEILQIAMPISANDAPILALWVPFVFIGNYFFLVYVMTAQLLENKEDVQ